MILSTINSTFRYAAIILLYLHLVNCDAQDDITPPDLVFTDVQPDWLYISVDTNYVRSEIDVWSSPYWGRRILNTLEDDDHLYLLEASRAQSPNGGEDGFLLSKVDKTTGVAVWVLHKNSLAGNQFREEYFDYGLQWDVTNDDQIVVHGMAANDSISFEQGIIWYRARPTISYINREDGSIAELKYGAPSPEDYNSWVLIGNRTILQDDNLYHLTRSDDIVEGYSQSYTSIFETDDNCTIDTSAVSVITNKAASSYIVIPMVINY